MEPNGAIPERPEALPRRRSGAPPAWAELPDEQLLKLRLCDLRLTLRGTVLEARVRQVYRELKEHGLAFRPHFWLSSEFFAADGVPGVAIPFYLAHPRLMQLEHKMMLEVEGGTPEWCMKILRHEVGHAIDNAYRLHRRREWRKQFGRFSTPYPEHYQPKPYSRRFVLHLNYWYAQSHPCEDFAETFAVWLTPGLDWRQRYKGWPALAKLEYVDGLMRSLAGVEPAVKSRSRVEPLHTLRTTLQEHYDAKRAWYGKDRPAFYDRDLRRLFSDSPEAAKNELASRFLQRIRREIRRRVAFWTGEPQYRIDQVLGEMIQRCRELKLRTNRPDEQATLEAAILVAVQTMNYLHSGRHLLAL